MPQKIALSGLVRSKGTARKKLPRNLQRTCIALYHDVCLHFPLVIANERSHPCVSTALAMSSRLCQTRCPYTGQMSVLIFKYAQAAIATLVKPAEFRRLLLASGHRRCLPALLFLFAAVRALPAHQYCTRQNTRPAAGAFSPAAVRLRASSTSRTHSGLR